ncbi:MAG: hypothetical protein ABIT08_06850 [Bacteroidia bacterium]
MLDSDVEVEKLETAIIELILKNEDEAHLIMAKVWVGILIENDNIDAIKNLNYFLPIQAFTYGLFKFPKILNEMKDMIRNRLIKNQFE